MNEHRYCSNCGVSLTSPRVVTDKPEDSYCTMCYRAWAKAKIQMLEWFLEFVLTGKMERVEIKPIDYNNLFPMEGNQNE